MKTSPVSDEAKKKTKVTAATLLKKLKLEQKKTKLLKLKLAKSIKLTKATKLKLLKYQRAYLKLKKASTPVPSDNSATEARLAQLTTDLKKAEDRMGKTLVLYKDTKAELAGVKNTLREAQESLRQSQHNAVNPAELVKAREQAARVEKELAGARRDHQALKQELESTQSESEKLKDELTQLRAQNERLETERSEQSSRLAKLAESFAALQETHQQSTLGQNVHWEDAQVEIRSLKEQLEEAESSHQTLQETYEQTKSQLASRETEHEEALLKLWDLEEKIQTQGDTVGGALEAKNAEIEELKKNLQQIQDRLASEESEKEKAQARLNESRDEAARLEKERDALSQQLDEAKEQRAALESSAQNLRHKLVEQSAALETLRTEHATILEQLESLRTENQQFKHASQEPEGGEPAEKRATRAESRLKEVEEQLVETRARLLSIHNEMDAADQAKRGVEDRNTELEKELNFRSSQMQQLENLISLLEQKEETHNRQLAAMRRQITELLEDNGRLKEEVADKSGKLKTIERSFEETDESLTNVRRRYETTRDTLELNKSQLTEARNRALLNLTRAEEAEKRYSEAERQSKIVAEENKVLKRRVERLQERVAELEMLS